MENERLFVYLVQHLCDDGSYEVVAITSTEEKAFDAIDVNYYRKTGHEPGFKEGMCSERHGRNYWTETVYQNQIDYEEFVKLEKNGFRDYELLGERRYAIACCEVDDPYWFGKGA